MIIGKDVEACEIPDPIGLSGHVVFVEPPRSIPAIDRLESFLRAIKFPNETAIFLFSFTLCFQDIGKVH